ncbi:MAG: cation:proton antiporter [Cellulomonadaceae bacterium]|jgi:Kef-type K+ transport system membrane component KefB|nr:cation:proton antiporter [Cellulomonadaceae bacterium]
MDSTLITLVVILAMVATAPLLSAALSRWIQVPVVVSEMFLGIVVGPGVLALIERDATVAFIGWMGSTLLFFIAGYETDFKPLAGKPVIVGSVAWVVCLVLAVVAGTVIAAVFPMDGVYTTTIVSGIFIGAALVSTALGSILPMMRDADEVDTLVGRAVISSGVIGQFAPLAALAILVGTNPPPLALVKHVIFVGVILGWLRIAKYGMPAFLRGVHTRTLETGGQWGVRIQVLLCFAVVTLAIWLGVDRLIGAFGAGVVMRVLLARTAEPERVAVERKVRSASFGIFIPIFFVNAGVTFDLPGLMALPQAFALIPVFLLLMFLVRGLPGSATLARTESLTDRAATSFLVGTGLAAVIVMAELGLEAGAVTSVVAAAMMGAAKISALVFPTVGLNLARRERIRRGELEPQAP